MEDFQDVVESAIDLGNLGSSSIALGRISTGCSIAAWLTH
jgi:hypothetical protein